MAITALVVDDDKFDRTLIKKLLNADSAFSDVLEEDSAERALERVGELSEPCVVVTDLWMPRMDGLQLITRLKATDVTSTVPVVALSSSDASVDRDRSMKAGASAFLTKPSTRAEFQALVQKITDVAVCQHRPGGDQGEAAQP